MKRASFILVLSIIFIFSLLSCKSYKNFAYIQNSDTVNLDKNAVLYDMTIKPKDILVITVHSEDIEFASKFNKVENSPNNGSSTYIDQHFYNYLVDNKGFINFPMVGKIDLLGLTINEAQNKIKTYPLAELNKRIFKSANRFVVNVVYILKDCKCTYFP